MHVVMMRIPRMLILAETLIEMKDQFNGKVIVIHQPEKKCPGGAKGMIEDVC